MRVLVVTPRWGPSIIGGAERAARLWATGLASRGHEVRAMTTTATTLSWEPALPEGEDHDEGVLVLRRDARAPRDPDVQRLLDALAPLASRQPLEAARRAIEAQGPIIDGLDDHVAWADVVIGYPYLYWPTLRAAELARRRFVLHPAAHPEPWLALAAFAPVFEGIGGIVYQTRAERTLVERTWRTGSSRSLLVPPPFALAPRDETPDHDVRSLVLYVGRFERDKGARALVALAEGLPPPLRLVAVGPVIEQPPPTPGLELAGIVDAARLDALRDQALAAVVFSRYESFSLAGAEALARGVPLVVNASNDALVELAQTSCAGIVVRDGLDALAAVHVLRDAPERWRVLSRRALAWARSRDPAHQLDRYERFLAAVAAGAIPRRR